MCTFLQFELFSQSTMAKTSAKYPGLTWWIWKDSTLIYLLFVNKITKSSKMSKSEKWLEVKIHPICLGVKNG